MRARAVATSIAAMEFDVRLSGRVPRTTERDQAGDDLPQEFPGPYRIEVQEQDWPALRDVLDEIIDEQVEFDRALEDRGIRRRRRVALWIGAAGAAQAVIVWRLIDP